jgi:hypothetical protein
MKARESVALCMFERAQGFFNANPDIAGSLATSTSRRTLDAVITDLRQSAADQGSSAAHGKGATQTQRALRAALLDDHMRPIAAIARQESHDGRLLPALRVSAKKRADSMLCVDALAMADAAAPHAGVFIAAGLALDFLDQLRTAAKALACMATHRSTHRSTGVMATVGIKLSIKRGRTAVQALDAVLSSRLRDNPAMLAQWKHVTTLSQGVALRSR